MKTWLIHITRHHNVEDARPYSILVEADTFQDALVESFRSILVDEFSCSLNDALESQLQVLKDAVAKIVVPVPDNSGQAETLLQLQAEPEDDERLPFLIWHFAPTGSGPLRKPNIGIGPGYQKDNGEIELAGRSDNRWLDIKEWDGNPSRRAELASLSKEQLIDLLCRCETVS